MKIKKLLSLMSITACATVSSSSVVACGGGGETTTISSKDISKRLIKEIQSFNEAILSSGSKDDTEMKENINNFINDKEETISKIIDIFCKELNKQGISNKDFLNSIDVVSKIMNNKNFNIDKDEQELINSIKTLEKIGSNENNINIEKNKEIISLIDDLELSNYIKFDDYKSKIKTYTADTDSGLSRIITIVISILNGEKEDLVDE